MGRTIAIVALVAAGVAIAGGLWWSRAKPAPVAEAASAAPASPELEGVVMYVLEPASFVRKDKLRRADALARLEINDEVRVSREQVSGDDGEAFRRVISGAGAGGYIAEVELSPERTTAAARLDAARDALGKAELDLAVREASRAVAIDWKLREGWDLLAAIHDARGDMERAREAYQFRKNLPAPEKAPEAQPRFGTPLPGEKRFVAATKLRARREASRTGEVITELALNDEVTVILNEGEFSRVRWSSAAQQTWIIDLTGEGLGRRVDSGAKENEGFVAFAYLAPEPLVADVLLREADAYLSASNYVDAARSLERAAILDPSAGLRKKLVHTAAMARLYPLAAETAVKLTAAQEDTSAAVAESQLIFGCEKDPPNPTVASCEIEAGSLPTCRPCAPTDPGVFLGDDATEEEKRAAEEEYSQNQRAAAAADRAHEHEVEKFEQAEEKLRARYPSGPWFRAFVRGDDALAEDEKRVFVIARGFSIGGYCGNFETTVDAPAISAGDIPWPKSGESLELWAKGESFDNTVWTVIAADNQEEASRLFVEGGAYSADKFSYSGEPGTFVPAPNLIGRFQACADCCGC